MAPSRWLSRVRALCSFDRARARAASITELALVHADFAARLRYDRRSSPERVLAATAAQEPEVVMRQLDSGLHGLTAEEAAMRLKITGLNLLSIEKPPTWWQIFLGVLPNPFNILLVLLAVLSVATPSPNWPTFVILMLMITISVVVRFWQEYRSNVAAIKLRESVSTDVTVRRDMGGKAADFTVDERDLVPGDIVLLSPGDTVPVDGLVIESSNMQISQSSLTGESEPVRKRPSAEAAKEDASLFESENLVFMGTSVISGSGAVMVRSTGDDAFIATVMKQVNKKRPLNSFQRGIRNVLVISAKITKSWSNAALFSVSVAVGLVPEMLPAIVNGNLARGAFTLARKKAIVKRLDAVQNLGGMSVLCSDKTGTLTLDEISLCHHVNTYGREDGNLLRLAYTIAAHQSGKKNSIDAAILRFVDEGEEKEIGPVGEKIAEIPFSFEKRRSSCIIRSAGGKHVLLCKGAFEEILMLSSHAQHGDEPVHLDGGARRELVQLASAYNDDGYRVIGVASKEVDENDVLTDVDLDHLHSDMTVCGVLTFLDPIKDDAAASIKRLQSLGVDVKILTGDNLRVALKVCRTLDLVTEVDEEAIQAITGPHLANMEPEDFDNAVKSGKIFAKLTPNQKGQVIMSLKKAGHTVGMLGDGINDCIALRCADAGISVDTGAAVAKDCADVILTQKELGIIVDCVLTGRLTHGNTVKYIKMVASSNFGNVFSILIASAWLPYNPMTSLQILIQNLLYDISQIAIPWDRMDEEYLQAPRNWDAKDLIRFVLVLGPTSSTIDMCTFALNWFYYGIRTAHSSRVAMAQTHWFLEGLLTQTLIVHLLRTTKIPLFQRRAAPVMVVMTVAIMLIGFAIPYVPPFQRTLALVRPAPSFLGFLLAELVLYCVGVQLVKMAYLRLFKTWI
ncbi:MAG: hypothetical protein M1826_006581 [Phylliscum demangeonii]|nr:MAG: hypothetical protein M1826_006581 [Phylliscum demangeonii]